MSTMQISTRQIKDKAVTLDKLKLAEFININDPQTIAGINALAAAGLLAEDRAREILTNPPGPPA